MSYTKTYSSTRPSLDVDYFVYPPSMVTYIRDNYVLTGLRIGVSKTFSQDMLTRNFTTIWADESAWNQYSQDPTIQSLWTQLRQYNSENGIVGSLN